VARPKHGENGFLRAGKFKKASNMNFALDISNRVEDILCDLMENTEKSQISQIDQDETYKQALAQVLEQSGIAWAGGNIRIGELILIVDSDTRVVSFCFFYHKVNSTNTIEAGRLFASWSRRDVSKSRSCHYSTQRWCYASCWQLF